jgi:hypothetical protein
MISVKKDSNGDIRLSVVGTKYHTSSSQCKVFECSASIIDLSERWYDAARTSTWTKPSFAGVHLPLFTLGRKGDTRVQFFEKKYTTSAYLSTDTLANAGEWGKDIDARRVVLISGAGCGSKDFWSNQCIRNFHPKRDETTPGTANEQYWIFSMLGGNGCNGNSCITMNRVRVYVDTDKSLKIAVVGAKRHYAWTKSQTDVMSADEKLMKMDVHTTPTGVGALFAGASWSLSTQTSSSSPSSGGIGIGAFKYALAPEMVPSLTFT